MNRSRRDFLRRTVLAGAAVSAGQISLAAMSSSEASPREPLEDGLPAPALPAPSWVDRPMRWAQLTLVEDDPGRFDPQFWLDYFRRTRSDAVCLSAGGCVAYYPTQVPFHHRSAWMGDRDPFGDLVAGSRALGMVVIARTDPHATYDDARDAHPEWIAVDAEGHPRRHWASPEMWVTCALGAYNFEHMTAVKREIASRYAVDGIFINRWDGSGMCYCESCARLFREATGLALPRTSDPQDAARRAYIIWRQERLFALWQLWDREVRRLRPDACVIPNTGGGATSSLDMRRIGQLAPTLFADRQARRGLAPPWMSGKSAKEYRAALGPKPIVGIFSVGLEEPYRWKDSVQSEAEIRLWVADGVANGLRPWFTKFSGVLHDRRWLKPVEDLYLRLARWEPYLRNEAPLARVAMVYSQQTAWFHGGDRAGARVEDPALGWYQALIEARIPFEMAHDRLLDPGHLAPFKTLILPNIAALSDAQCDQLRAFVRRGGSLIATQETSLCDEWGVRRKTFGLADILGVDFTGRTEPRMQNAYLRLEHEAAPGHPLLRGLEEAPRIIHGVSRVEVQARAAFPPSPLTLIPSYPDLPMEKVYPRAARTDTPQVYLRELPGGGDPGVAAPNGTTPRAPTTPGTPEGSATSGARIVYFPWDIDRTFWEVLCVDHLRLLQNAVAWATSEPPIVEVSGPGVLDVTVWRQASSITVHLVNLTTPMMMKGPVRELLPVGPQRVRVRLPAGARPQKAQLLASGTTLELAPDGHSAQVTVPSILDHEVLAIDLA